MIIVLQHADGRREYVDVPEFQRDAIKVVRRLPSGAYAHFIRETSFDNGLPVFVRMPEGK